MLVPGCYITTGLNNQEDISFPAKFTELGLHYSSTFDLAGQTVISNEKDRRLITLPNRTIGTSGSKLLMYKIHVRPILKYC